MRGFSTSCGNWPAVLGAARDAEVLAERYERALDELPAELVRGPVRERLVDGAKQHYQAGLRRSLIAMRSQRYFRLLDALEGLVAAEPPPPQPGEEPAQLTIDSAYRRVRKAAKAAAEAADADRADEALHRIRKGAKRLRYTAAATGDGKVSERAKTIQTLLGDHQDSVVSRTHLSHQAEAAHAAGEDTFTYGLLYQLEDSLARRSREQLDEALKKLDRSVRKSREPSGRTSWPVSRILSLAAAYYHGDEAATIHLDTPLPGASSGLPAGSGEQPSNACAAAPPLRHSWPCFGWGLPSHSGHPECWCALTAPFHPYHR